MRKLRLFVLVMCLSAGHSLFAQKEPNVSISLLANELIADVNIDQQKFVKSLEAAVNVVKKEFNNVAATQKIAVVITVHKTGKPAFSVYSQPSLPAAREEKLLSEIGKLTFENTKLVDFPVAISVNVKQGELLNEFKDIKTPADEARADYEKASIAEKIALNKAWAIQEVIPVLSAYTANVDEKFAGVKKTGLLLKTTDFSKPQDIAKLIDHNADYWRAILEMTPGNQIIPAAKIFMHVSQGQFDYAKTLLDIVNLFSDPKTTTSEYLRELGWRLNVFNKDLNTAVNAGIKEHDKENYTQAINIYNSLLTTYPNSAWAQYELYYSQKALSLQNNTTTKDDPTDWNNAKKLVYAANPLYNMDVHASNAKEGYLLFRRQSMNDLFKTKENRLKDVFKYADIAMDLGVYDFAAQLFWFSFIHDKTEPKALNRFLYCLEKLGVTNLKTNFKGEFDKEFKKIDEEKEKEMKESSIYKSFKE